MEITVLTKKESRRLFFEIREFCITFKFFYLRVYFRSNHYTETNRRSALHPCLFPEIALLVSSSYYND